MGVNYQHIKRYQNFFGIDLKSNDLAFPEQYATEVNNVQFTATGTLEKRVGYQATAEAGAKYGLFTYNRIDSDGVEQPEVLGCSDTVQRLATTTITVSYSGTALIADLGLSFDPDTGVFRCTIQEGATFVLNLDLGVGRDETTPVTVSDLVAAIDALANFSASVSGDSSVPAAFIQTTPLQSILNAPASLTARYWESLNTSLQTGKTGPLEGSEERKDELSFENVTAVQLQNCIYFSNGYDPVLKYDGQNVYRAGLPPSSDGTDSAYTISATGSTGTNEVYVWRQQFVQVDAHGNSVEGNTAFSSEYGYKLQTLGGYTAGAQNNVTTLNVDNGSGGNNSLVSGTVVYFLTTSGYVKKTLTGRTGTTITFAGAVTVADNVEVYTINNATVTLSNIQAGSGYNTNCAIVAGAQGPVNTIVVDNGSGGVHTMKVGDTAYFYDSVSGGYVEREVTAIDTTSPTYSITVDGAAVTVADNAVISNNLRIRVLRNQNTTVSPTLWFELIEIPNNSFAATQTYTDNDPDAFLFTQFLEPATDRSPPVKGKYLSAYQNLMVTAGDPANPNQVSVSDLENPEYFPLVSNQFTVTNLQGDMITGIHPASESFIIFQSRAIHAVTGDVPTQSFRVDVITQDIGCVAHATIKDVRGKICFMSPVGPRIMQGASIPAGLGTAVDNPLNSRIDPLFSVKGLGSDQILRLKRAVALNDRRGERYLIFVPAESETAGVRYTNNFSKTLVYDYTRDSWVVWSNLDMTGGVTTNNDDQEILFVERRDSDATASLTLQRYAYRFNSTGTYLDYQDHDEPISLTYKSPWEFMGNVAILKNFQRIKVYSAEQSDSAFELQIQTEKDFTADAAISTCSIDFDATGYGDGEWDLGPFADPAGPGFKHKLSNGRATSLRVIFSNEEPQTNVAITGYELEINAPYAPGFKS